MTVLAPLLLLKLALDDGHVPTFWLLLWMSLAWRSRGSSKCRHTHCGGLNSVTYVSVSS